jgi:glycosyltransferase involved in cell wall biosynthesis
MRILFFSHYFPPEVNAPATRTREHAVRWAQAGHDVTVVTCVPNCPVGRAYPGYRNRLWPQVEFIDGVRVVRVWTYLAPNAGTVRRIANYLSYFASAVIASLALPRPDVVIATSPQFFCGWAGIWSARLKGAPRVIEVRDIWPESIAAVGALRGRGLLRFLKWLERRMYLAADRIVTVGEGYRARILESADVADRVNVVTNGVDLARFVPRPPDAAFLSEQGLAGKFVCSYVGTLGMAHGLDVVIEAAGLLEQAGRDDIRFCLVGEGAQRRRLEEAASRGGIRSVVFAGRQPSDRIPAILASSDACLIHLKDCDLFDSVIPSKMFEAMAMGRPLIAGVRGEAQQIIRRAGAGLEMAPGCARSLADCVTRLADNSALRGRLGTTAREFVARHYDRDRLALEMLEVVRAAASGTPADARLVQPSPSTTVFRG